MLRLSVLTDKRLLLVVALGIAIRYFGGWAFQDAMYKEYGDPRANTAIQDPGVLETHRDNPLVDSIAGLPGAAGAEHGRTSGLRVTEKVRRPSRPPEAEATGSSGAPLGALAAAVAFGGVVLAVGGAGAFFLWRRAEEEEAVEIELR